ncbi:beta-lactamase-like protein [Pisolithus microcarpus]|nr:beta-lactamase-like protein [Pisolithus microcarpus]
MRLRQSIRMKIVPVPVREDNYAYLLVDEPTNKAAAVDPYDVPKVQAAANQLGVSIIAAITTHHHFDHSGGNEASKYPGAPIYGGSSKIPKLCLATPCHTQDSICYHVTDTAKTSQPGGVFTGDTLFIGGCGNFFEGTGEEMHAALSYLGTLPDETVTYPFAITVEPTNADVSRLYRTARENTITTGESTIGDEKLWNVFMRSSQRGTTGLTGDGSAIVTKLRQMKNSFRG